MMCLWKEMIIIQQFILLPVEGHGKQEESDDVPVEGSGAEDGQVEDQLVEEAIRWMDLKCNI